MSETTLPYIALDMTELETKSSDVRVYAIS